MSRSSFATAVPSALSLLALMSTGSAEAAAFSVNYPYGGVDHVTSVNRDYQSIIFNTPVNSGFPGFPIGLYSPGSGSCTASYIGSQFSLGDCVGAFLFVTQSGVTTSHVVAAGATNAELNTFYNVVDAFFSPVLDYLNFYQYEATSGTYSAWTAPMVLDFSAPVSSPDTLVLLGAGLLGLVSRRRRAA